MDSLAIVLACIAGSIVIVSAIVHVVHFIAYQLSGPEPTADEENEPCNESW